jgi:uncharacterized peroxidase-related enzyme
MARIQPAGRDTDPKTREILMAVKKQMGMLPNLIATMARSPAVVRAYLGFSQGLSEGSLPASVRERISLAVSESNQCNYCVSAHTLLAGKAGVDELDILDARRGTASDEKVHAALAFARKIVEDRGHINDEDVEEVRRAGYSDGEIVEIVANVAFNILTNYINHVADTEIDFPLAASLATV